jgi:hypothetical protein
MGGKGMNRTLKDFARASFPDFSGDLFACFAKRAHALASKSGRVSIVAPFVWMFLSSYEKLREWLLNSSSLQSLVQLEYNAFEPACIPVATFNLSKPQVPNFQGTFIRLSSFKGHRNQAPKTLEAIQNPDCGWLFKASSDDFKSIPGSPISYWLPDGLRESFRTCAPIKSICPARRGLETGDNSRFLRHWHELNLSDISLGAKGDMSFFSWVPYNKGGPARKWSNNSTLCVYWKHNGLAVRDSGVANGEDSYLKEGITWSGLTSSIVTFRHSAPGYIFDSNKGAMMFPPSDLMHYILGFLNSAIANEVLSALNPTLSTQNGDIDRLPIYSEDDSLRKAVGGRVKRLLDISYWDWNAYERSWDFSVNTLLAERSQEASTDLKTCYSLFSNKSADFVAETTQLEASNNEAFYSCYRMTEEIRPVIPADQVTLTVNPAYRYGGDLSRDEQWIRFRRDTLTEFLSYATGSMMGRYSLDQPGLILADSRHSQAAHLVAYEEKVGKPIDEVQFKPDPDGIIPVLDGEWFEDDIVARTREFLEVTFPESTVTENLRFIEESLAKDIRKYFCSDFYKDHLQTYKKRPIYWMVQSPKKGFSCLIYLHRYTKDTLNQVLNNYFRPYLQKLEARLAQLGLDQLNDSLPTRERTAARKEAEKITKVLKECEAWEQDALLPLAQQRIELDLDDGVKVNYLKLQDVLAPIPGLAAKED